MKRCVFEGQDRLRTAPCDGRWLAQLQLWRPNDPDVITTGDVETAVILLSGTFDLMGGSTAWPARGARQTPLSGRPMAVFLPKNTPFRTQRGQGEILLVAARQPEAPAPGQGRGVFGQSPLLQLAGSGKAFDPTTGEWRPAETFPTSAESLPPRRMTQLQVGACVVERVFASDYKAATLSVDEVVLPPGQSLAVADIPGRPRADEVLVFVRTEAAATVSSAGQAMAASGDAAFCVATGPNDVVITAERSPAYVVLAYAGKG